MKKINFKSDFDILAAMKCYDTTGNSWSWGDMAYNFIGSSIGCLGGLLTYAIHILWLR